MAFHGHKNMTLSLSLSSKTKGKTFKNCQQVWRSLGSPSSESINFVGYVQFLKAQQPPHIPKRLSSHSNRTKKINYIFIPKDYLFSKLEVIMDATLFLDMHDLLGEKIIFLDKEYMFWVPFFMLASVTWNKVFRSGLKLWALKQQFSSS